MAADRLPVGHASLDKSYDGRAYQTHQLELPTGTWVYLTSDGFTDQFGGPRGRKFGRTPFIELLAASSHLPADQQFQQLGSALRAWAGSTPQTDDIIVLGFSV